MPRLSSPDHGSQRVERAAWFSGLPFTQRRKHEANIENRVRLFIRAIPERHRLDRRSRLIPPAFADSTQDPKCESGGVRPDCSGVVNTALHRVEPGNTDLKQGDDSL